VGSLRFNPEDPTSLLGRGDCGHVCRGQHGDGCEACAVQRVDRLRFEEEGGLKEIQALRHAQDTADDGHRNVVRIIDQQEDANWGPPYAALGLSTKQSASHGGVEA
jgi:hypothetical protein